MSIGFYGLLAATALVGAIAQLSLASVDGAVHRVTAASLPAMIGMEKVTAVARDQRMSMILHVASEPADQAPYEAAISKKGSEFRAALQELQKSAADEDGASDAIQRIESSHQGLERAWDKVGQLSRAGSKKEALAMWMSDGVPASQTLLRSLDEFSEIQVAKAKTDVGAATQSASSGKLWIWLILAASMLLGGIPAFFVVRNVSLVLRSAVDELSGGAQQVASAAGQVSSSSQSLAQGASVQAASLEETAASSEEITSRTRKNADNSRSAATVMAQVDEKVTEANHNLQEMVTSMQEITASSDKISKIIKVIDEIAFQTNILALNAAVEAARAGEAGMGFAVVADEVRNLAQRSAQAAKDTAGLIEESIAKSAEGSHKLDRVAAAVRNITEHATRVKALVDEVNVGSQEQARGIEQISRAISQMDQVTQNNAASAEESASASEELNAQAEVMMSIVNKLYSMVGAADASVAPANGGNRRNPSKATPASTHSQAQTSLSNLRNAVSKGGGAKPVSSGMANAQFESDGVPADARFTEF